MNFYKRFMGDYIKDTAHLSMAEHGAYTLLLDHYYATEQPLPDDYMALYRICRAFDKAEQRAVRSVADAYFPLVDGVRRNRRADIQLLDDSARIETARVNGKKGGRPRKETQSDNEYEPSENPVGFDLDTQWGTQQEPNQKAHHSHSHIKEKNTSADASLAARFDEFWENWPGSQRKVAKAECQKRWKARRLDSVADQILGHVVAMRQTKQWQDGFEPAPLTYLNQKRWEDGIQADLGPDEQPWEGAL